MPSGPLSITYASLTDVPPCVGQATYFTALVGCLLKDIAVETPHLLWITVWMKSAPCLYPGTKFHAYKPNPLVD